MAKIPSFTDGLLTEAVVKYSKATSGKIVAEKLARWAAENIPGLENVKGYHFMRPLGQKAPLTGKTVSKKRICTLRIEELNTARMTRTRILKNPLLHSVNVEECLRMPESQLCISILDAREQMDRLMEENIRLGQRNVQLEAKNAEYKSSLENQEARLREMAEEVEGLSKSISRLIRMGDEAQRKAALESIGFKDGGTDLDAYAASLSAKIKENLSINEAIRGVTRKTGASRNMLEGLNF